MKAINWHLSKLWLNCGWFPGDPFKAFCFTFGETQTHFLDNRIDWITFLSIQVAYFFVGFGWREE